MRSKNIVVCILCLFIILMIIGYVVFVVILNINGKSTSNWNVHLGSITTSNITGSAKDVPYDEILNPDGTRTDNLSATFKTQLVSPGDSITYLVVVNNAGTIDARLDSIDVSDTTNSAIMYSIGGIEESDVLAPNESKSFMVTVSYDELITQSDILTSTLTVTLNFVQN